MGYVRPLYALCSNPTTTQHYAADTFVGTVACSRFTTAPTSLLKPPIQTNQHQCCAMFCNKPGNIQLQTHQIISSWLLIAACIADADIIFLPCGFFYLLFFLSSPNLSGRRVDVYHISTHGVALVRI